MYPYITYTWHILSTYRLHIRTRFAIPRYPALFSNTSPWINKEWTSFGSTESSKKCIERTVTVSFAKFSQRGGTSDDVDKGNVN
jgi:hypothetical protein